LQFCNKSRLTCGAENVVIRRVSFHFRALI
jgi:hypothetical protein